LKGYLPRPKNPALWHLGPLACFSTRRPLYFPFAVVVAVNDFAKADLSSRRFREHKWIKGQQRFVIIAEFVREDVANGDELR
jgi:hypothetical protein